MTYLNKDFLSTERNRNDILELCQSTDKKIVLMPAGQQAISFSRYLKEHSVNVDFFVDNSKDKQGKYIDNVPIVSFEEYQKTSNDKFMVIATNEYIEEIIINRLKENNNKNYKCIIADYLCYSADEIDNARELILKNFENYSRLYNMLEDDLSKKTLINKLNYLITYDKKYLKEIARPLKNQYFEPDIYNISSEDYFVDCGAFDGDTLKILMINVNNQIKGYYGFEPDDANFLKLHEKSKCCDNVKIFKKGVFKENSLLKFNSSNTSYSQISETGNTEVDVVSLDNTLKDKKITFVKMDIEGAEYDALLGAKNLITGQKPVLAIAVYHNFDDIYKIPFLIESFGLKYKYYLRHYTKKSSETVLYAVPDNYTKGFQNDK